MDPAERSQVLASHQAASDLPVATAVMEPPVPLTTQRSSKVRTAIPILLRPTWTGRCATAAPHRSVELHQPFMLYGLTRFGGRDSKDFGLASRKVLEIRPL